MPPHSGIMNTPRRSTYHPAAHPSPHRSEQGSTASASQNSHAPSSVYLAPHPLSRDLSDLSGSYANGISSRNSRGPVPGMVFGEQTPGTGPWRQAYLVSQLPPANRSSNLVPVSPASAGRDTTILLGGHNDSVELVVDDNYEGTLDLSKLESQGHNRIPVAVLLMDGNKHSYELLQIWIDRGVDSVRDVIQAVQRGIPEKWKQAYDGIFQVRGNRFTQLIHILRMAKYDIQPHEILIAKPWSMSAKVTIAFATSVIRHLTSIGIVNTNEEEKPGRRVFRPKSIESPLVLSRSAQTRVYAPDGILSHHHAVHFLSFSPTLSSSRQKMVPAHNDETNSSIGSHYSSVGSGPTFKRKSSLVEELHASLKAGILEETPSLMMEQRQQPEPPGSVAGASLHRTTSSSPVDHSVPVKVLYDAEFDTSGGSRRRTNVSFVMAQLNCYKNKERVAALTCCSPAPTDVNNLPTTFGCCKTKELDTPLVSSDHWTGFDVRPIAEDYSEASRSAATPVGSTAGRGPSRMSTPLVSAPSLSGFQTRSSSNYRPRRLMEY